MCFFFTCYTGHLHLPYTRILNTETINSLGKYHAIHRYVSGRGNLFELSDLVRKVKRFRITGRTQINENFYFHLLLFGKGFLCICIFFYPLIRTNWLARLNVHGSGRSQLKRKFVSTYFDWYTYNYYSPICMYIYIERESFWEFTQKT